MGAFLLVDLCSLFLVWEYLLVVPVIVFPLLLFLDVIFFFFFSSRRRHTRCLSDWSSDVCSSDLVGGRARMPGCLSASCTSIPMRFPPNRCRACGAGTRPRCASPGPVRRARRSCGDRKSTRLNSSHLGISYAVFCLKQKKKKR